MRVVSLVPSASETLVALGVPPAPPSIIKGPIGGEPALLVVPVPPLPPSASTGPAPALAVSPGGFDLEQPEMRTPVPNSQTIPANPAISSAGPMLHGSRFVNQYHVG